MKSLHAMVIEAAIHHGAKTAAIFDTGASPATCLSYDELVALGNELCRNLQGAVGENKQFIGVFCDVDIFLPVWIFGVLQVPAAYVPLDPVSPTLLTMRIMDSCHLKFCLIQSTLLQRFQGVFSSLLSVQVIADWSAVKLTLVKLHKNQQVKDNLPLQTEQEHKQHLSAEDCGKKDQAEELAYVLHTSGTTGLPKIVKVPHKCIVSNIVHLSSLFQMTPEDVVFLASPLTFDPSVVEMFLALASGAGLLMVPSAVRRMPARLANVLFRRNATTVLQATPTLMRRFGGRVLQEEILSAGSSLKVLALGGEVCPSLFLLNSWRQAGNKTCIYNLYGTTEVSCWACCYKLPDDLTVSADHTDSGSVPLGEALMDTAVEVRDENGDLVTEGEGQVFIGGQERVCWLDDETMSAAVRVMRATGDWVTVQNSQLYYLGRKDRLVKRHGQMLHLDALQQALESLPEVEAGVVGLNKTGRLVAFVVPTLNRKTMSSENSGNQEQHVHSSTKAHEGLRVSSRALEKEVLRGLSQIVPSHSIPDTVLLVPALPLTNHGKVALEKLMRMFERQKEINGKHTGTGDRETLRERLQALWKDCLGLCDDGVVADDAHFMLSGGDSLQALRLFNYIKVSTETASEGLLEVLLDGSFSDVLNHITAAHQNPVKKLNKRLPEDSASVVLSKRRYHTEADPGFNTGGIVPPVGSSGISKRRFVVVRRAGDVFRDCFPNRELAANAKEERDNMDSVQEEYPSLAHSPLSISKTNLPVTNSSSVQPTDIHVPSGVGQSSGVTLQAGIRNDSQPLNLHVRWSSDTGRCVDASPVILVSPERITVFIGSHSHRLQALDLSTGEVVWERVLGDRLESSAAVSRCGTLVALGCYDGQVYFLSVVSGETCWVFQTGDAVKSSPAVDPQTGLVIIGSHDGHVYALEPLVKRCVWKHYCGGGAVFSSPCVHSSPRRLYSATLNGQLCCLSPDSGTVLWTYSTDAPFFSSPSCCDSCVCVGLVNGRIIALSHDGNMLWDFLTDGPVFSSPCLASPPSTGSGAYTGCSALTLSCPTFFCGSHDSSVYCINSTNGSLLWRFQTTGKVYSSPFVFDGSPWSMKTLVAVASTDGTLWVLDGERGTLKASFHLPGELFSSPVVWGHAIVVGCRNDYVYCLEMCRKE